MSQVANPFVIPLVRHLLALAIAAPGHRERVRTVIEPATPEQPPAPVPEGEAQAGVAEGQNAVVDNRDPQSPTHPLLIPAADHPPIKWRGLMLEQ